MLKPPGAAGSGAAGAPKSNGWTLPRPPPGAGGAPKSNGWTLPRLPPGAAGAPKSNGWTLPRPPPAAGGAPKSNGWMLSKSNGWTLPGSPPAGGPKSNGCAAPDPPWGVAAGGGGVLGWSQLGSPSWSILPKLKGAGADGGDPALSAPPCNQLGSPSWSRLPMLDPAGAGPGALGVSLRSQSGRPSASRLLAPPVGAGG